MIQRLSEVRSTLAPVTPSRTPRTPHAHPTPLPQGAAAGLRR
jgi:hypothetical protein